MILVALGTQDKQFYRLLKIVDNAIEKGVIKDKVIAQIGSTKFESSNIELRKYIPGDELDRLVDEADLVICHGGVGIITNALKRNKKIFAMPRLKMFDEHRNDHQIQLVEKFTSLGYIRTITSYDDLVKEYKNLKKFKPKKPKFDNKKILSLVSDFIG